MNNTPSSPAAPRDQHQPVDSTTRSQPDDTGTDWDYLEALTPEENRANAESDPDAVILTPEQRRRLRPVPDPRTIREQLGLTQEAFSQLFEIPLGTLRDWEQGRRFIDASARTLLRAIAFAPNVITAAIQSGTIQNIPPSASALSPTTEPEEESSPATSGR